MHPGPLAQNRWSANPPRDPLFRRVPIWLSVFSSRAKRVRLQPLRLHGPAHPDARLLLPVNRFTVVPSVLVSPSCEDPEFPVASSHPASVARACGRCIQPRFDRIPHRRRPNLSDDTKQSLRAGKLLASAKNKKAFFANV